MNVLETLRDDMRHAGLKAYVREGDEIHACLEVLDEFIAGQEVVRVREKRCAGGHSKAGGTRKPILHYLYPDDCRLEGTPLTIIVPRKPEPTLLEAAKGMQRACGAVVIHSGRGDNIDEYHAAQRVLDRAIKKEEER